MTRDRHRHRHRAGGCRDHRRARRATASPPCTRRWAAPDSSGTALRPIQDGARIAGSAVTVLCWPGDNLMIHAAVEQCRRGRHPGRDHRLALARRLVRRAVRDRAAAPRRARARHDRRRPRRRRPARDGLPRLVRRRQRAGHRQGHRRLGQRADRRGRRDRPARATSIVADDDGVLCVPRAGAAAALAAADARVEKEAASRAAYQARRAEPRPQQPARRARRPRRDVRDAGGVRRRRRQWPDAVRDGIRCMLMRGGTSKGAYFLADDLPADAGRARRPAAADHGQPRPAPDRRARRRASR